MFASGSSILNQLEITDVMSVLVDYSPILNHEKEVEGLIIIVQDLPMVEEMAMEIELIKSSNKDLNAILANIYDEILVVNQKESCCAIVIASSRDSGEGLKRLYREESLAIRR